ncbi:extracellular solute-binding protein [Micromonospora peucetia]|uniref:Carbohydrate ABC transporter substrate-binding protein, CUT1 family n=1 Tax=Micromonospora peucetia TaxID=47871 RepID=A0A1C6VUY5_9ACTN|nr:extracellular solute-binding protein [Micromonospora peucetia]MCX4388083.1 extracellular solute-binding protein [Micromonospora peucetia]SCL70123.1 carbohydrate ABC transporter substrate-binding protein, CUT1 family [Micromonospora peucetia]
MGTAADQSDRVVEVWIPSYPAVPLFLTEVRELARAFEREHPGYRIEIVECSSYESLPEEVHRAAQRGHRPAIVSYLFTSTQLARDMRTHAGEPLFMPVQRAIGGRTEILGHPVVIDDLVPAARAYYTSGDELFALPHLTSTTLLYTNNSLLSKSGVREVPRTWSELTAACRKLAGRTGVAGPGVTWPNAGWIFQQAVAQQGAVLADPDNGRTVRAQQVQLDSEEMLAFVHWWQQLHRSGYYHYSGVRAIGDRTGDAWERNYRAFAEQRVAFVLSTSVEADRMVDAGRQSGFEVTASRMPHNGEVPYAGNVVGGDALWLSDGLDEATRDGALAFMQYLLSAEHAARRHKTTRFMPVTRSSVDLLDSEGWFEASPQHRAALDQLDASDGSYAARGALLGDLAGLHDVVTQAMDDVLACGADPDRRFAEASSQAQRQLDDYNADCLGERPGRAGPRRFAVN